MTDKEIAEAWLKKIQSLKTAEDVNKVKNEIKNMSKEGKDKQNEVLLRYTHNHPEFYEAVLKEAKRLWRWL